MELRREDFVVGNTVEFAGQKWNVLAEAGEDEFLCLNDDIICYKAFDENNCNNWEKSSLRRWLNGEYLERFNDVELIEQTQDLTADDGLKDYGTSTDLIFLLTAEQSRGYRDNIRKVNGWWWLATADSTINSFVRNVDTDGSLNYNFAFYGHIGGRPACVLHLPSYDK